MLLTPWLVCCALAFTTTALSQHHQYQLDPALERPVRFDEYESSENPLFSLHKNLVNIESISGNEQAVGEFLEEFLEAHNYTVERQYVEPLPRSLKRYPAEDVGAQKQRFNLLAYPGDHRQTPVLLSSVSVLLERCSRFPYRHFQPSCSLHEQNSGYSVLGFLRHIINRTSS